MLLNQRQFSFEVKENILLLEKMYAIKKPQNYSFMLKELLEFMSLVIPFNTREKMERDKVIKTHFIRLLAKFRCYFLLLQATLPF